MPSKWRAKVCPQSWHSLSSRIGFSVLPLPQHLAPSPPLQGASPPPFFACPNSPPPCSLCVCCSRSSLMAPRLGTKKREAVSHVTGGKRRGGKGRRRGARLPAHPPPFPVVNQISIAFLGRQNLLNLTLQQTREERTQTQRSLQARLENQKRGANFVHPHFLKAELPSGRGAGWPGMMDVVAQPISGEGSAGCREEGGVDLSTFS